jgi:hypothetical protein
VWAIDAGVDVDADTGEDLAAYLRDWLDSQAPLLRATTVRSYRQMVEDYLIPQLGHHRLDGLDRRTLERAYRRLVAGGGRGGRPLRPSSWCWPTGCCTRRWPTPSTTAPCGCWAPRPPGCTASGRTRSP